MRKRTLRVDGEFVSLEHDDRVVCAGSFVGDIDILAPNAVTIRPDEDSDTVKRRDKRTIRVGGEFVSLEHDDRVLFRGTFTGNIHILAPNAVTVRPSEDYETLKRRVTPVYEAAQVASEVEAEEQAHARLEQGDPDWRDVLVFLARAEPGLYNTTTLHAAICGWSLEDSMRHLWTGDKPLYCPEFDGCGSHEERLDAWEVLPTARKEVLREKYGSGSTHYLHSHQRRSRFLDAITLAKEMTLTSDYNGPELWVYQQTRRDQRRPAHLLEYIQSLPRWQRTGHFYEVAPK